MAADRRIHVATILGAHGVRGEVRVRSFTSSPESIFAFDELSDEKGARVFSLKRKGVVRGNFIAAVKGVAGRDAAEALCGVKLFVARAALPPLKKREYYEVDLIGLEASDKDGKVYGEVVALHDHGAGAFLEIKPARGPGFMLPFNDTFVPDVNFKTHKITIFVPEGWPETEKRARPFPD